MPDEKLARISSSTGSAMMVGLQMGAVVLEQIMNIC
jgi:hypothetical protein